jgi:hypothetical protein
MVPMILDVKPSGVVVVVPHQLVSVGPGPLHLVQHPPPLVQPHILDQIADTACLADIDAVVAQVLTWRGRGVILLPPVTAVSVRQLL